MATPKNYFPAVAGAPPPLKATGRHRVTFAEVDMLEIAWHGHYISYFDIGRVAFGDKYGLSYMAMRQAGVAAPIVQIHLDYLSPLRFDAEIEVTASLYWSDALRLNFEYQIRSQGRLAAKGSSVQLFVDLQGQTIFLAPDFIAEFRQKWQDGEFK